MNMKKHNISIETNPNMAIERRLLGWGKVSQVVDLLKEYEGIFPSTFLEMKGITWDLWEMKIQLKPNEKPINRRL